MNQYNQQTQVTNFLSVGTHKFQEMFQFFKEQTKQQNQKQNQWNEEKQHYSIKIKSLENTILYQKKQIQELQFKLQKYEKSKIQENKAHQRVQSDAFHTKLKKEDFKNKTPLISIFLKEMNQNQICNKQKNDILTPTQVFNLTANQTQNRVWTKNTIEINYINLELKNTKILKSHLDSVRCLYFCQNPNILASASEDGLIKLWSVSSSSAYCTLRGHQDPILSLTGNQQQNTPNQQFDVLFSGGQMGVIRVWSVPGVNEFGPSKSLLQWNAHTDAIWDLKYHQNKDLLGFNKLIQVSSSADGTNKLWQTFPPNDSIINPGKLLSTFSYKIQHHYCYDIPTTICWIHDRIISGFQNISNLVIYDLENNQVQQEIPFMIQSQPNKILFSNAKIISAHDDGKIRLFDLNSNKIINTINAHQNSVSGIDIYKETQILSSVSHDGKLKLWDMRKYKCLSQQEPHQNKYDECIQTVLFNKQQMILATGGADSLIKIFENNLN